ncbi:hypothetical protein BH23BAC1_BH23BAC1_42560 [soil metagenome]
MKNSLASPFHFIFFMFSIIAFLGCEQEREEIGLSNINLSISEPPPVEDHLSGIHLFIKRIDLRGVDGWQTYKEFKAPLAIDILNPKSGNNFFLGEKLLPAGTYYGARLILDSQDKGKEIIANSGGYLEYKNGYLKPIFSPEKIQEGIKADGIFNLDSDGVVNVNLDFSFRKGTIISAGTERHLLKPTLKIVVDDDSGMIDGTFEDPEEFEKIVVFAYQDNMNNSGKKKNQPKSLSELSASSKNAVLNKDGKFILSFLKSGNYDLYFYAYDQEGNYQQVIGKLEKVQIEAGQKTMISISKDILN